MNSEYAHFDVVLMKAHASQHFSPGRDVVDVSWLALESVFSDC